MINPFRNPARSGKEDARPVVLALIAAILVCLLAFHFVRIRNDIVAFLPRGQTEATQQMVRQLRVGAATNLLLIGIEGAPPSDLARISRDMVQRLDRLGLFALIDNGSRGMDEETEDFLFQNRYLLSSSTKRSDFTTDALRADFTRLVAGLESPEAPFVEQFGLPDPTNAFPNIIQNWVGTSRLRIQDGVWFAPGRQRALMLISPRSDGVDTALRDKAVTAVQQVFAAVRPSHARLLLAGPALFAHDANIAIRADVRLLSLASAALTLALLLWRFRSPLIVAAIGVPIIFSVAIAALAVQIVFGFVQGVALGFGVTMLGVTVDYPVLLIGHRKHGEAARNTLRRIGTSFNLAVVSAAVGLTGMIFSGLPGLEQIGVFSVVGLLTGAATTRFVLPYLVATANLAPVAAGKPVRLLRLERARAWRLWALAVPILAGIYMLAHPPEMERDLAHLSPVPEQLTNLDGELRNELGAPDLTQFALVRGSSPNDVLLREEAVLPLLNHLRDDHTIAGADIAARYVPSIQSQLTRQANLPNDKQLAAVVAAALVGSPFRSDAFDEFQRDVAASRKGIPVIPSALPGPLMQMRLQSLLFVDSGQHFGLIAPNGVASPSRLEVALQGIPNVIYVDVSRESNGILVAIDKNAWRWLGFGCFAVALVLVAGLRRPLLSMRVLVSLTASIITTLAILSVLGVKLSLLQIVALQFVVGIGLDYGLFFARRQLDEEERARTLRTLLTCNAMTLASFGLLAFCHTKLLRMIGLPVTVGAPLVLIFSFLFVGAAAGEE